MRNGLRRGRLGGGREPLEGPGERSEQTAIQGDFIQTGCEGAREGGGRLSPGSSAWTSGGGGWGDSGSEWAVGARETGQGERDGQVSRQQPLPEGKAAEGAQRRQRKTEYFGRCHLSSVFIFTSSSEHLNF